MRRTILSVWIALGVAVGTANATPLNITDIDGIWINGAPAGVISALSNVAGGTDRVRWGGTVDDFDSGSGYDFTPAGNLVPAGLAVPLLLGQFTHLNREIFTDAITGIDYVFQFSTNGIPAGVGTTFHFDHFETDNLCNCSPGDDDVVTLAALNLNQLITVGTDKYFFNLLGFSSDNGVTFSNVFSSPEFGSNSVKLYGIVTDTPVNPVPEPASLVLLGTGLLAVARRCARMRK